MSILVHVVFVDIHFPFLGCVLKVQLIFIVDHHAYGIKPLRMPKIKGIFRNKTKSCRFWYMDFTNGPNSSASWILILCHAAFVRPFTLTLYPPRDLHCPMGYQQIRQSEGLEGHLCVQAHPACFLEVTSLVTWRHRLIAILPPPAAGRPPKVCMSLANTE